MRDCRRNFISKTVGNFSAMFSNAHRTISVEKMGVYVIAYVISSTISYEISVLFPPILISCKIRRKSGCICNRTHIFTSNFIRNFSAISSNSHRAISAEKVGACVIATVISSVISYVILVLFPPILIAQYQ